MKFVKSIALIIFSFISICNYAGDEKKNNKTEVVNAIISGKIIDFSDNQPLAGVKIMVEGYDKVYYTDFDGNYSIKDLPKGDYSLSIHMTSFVEKSISSQYSNNSASSTIKLFPN